MLRPVDQYLLNEMESADTRETILSFADGTDEIIEGMMEVRSRNEDMDILFPLEERFKEPIDTTTLRIKESMDKEDDEEPDNDKDDKKKKGSKGGKKNASD